MEITYTVGDVSYTATESFSISYLPEYDAFQAFDKFTVYDILRGCGTLTVGGIPDLEPDESEITTYRESYVIPLLAISVALFVIDVFIRKLRVSKKSSSKGKEKK